MSVTYNSTGTCLDATQRRIRALVAAQLDHVSVTWPAPIGAVLELSVPSDTPSVFHTTMPDGVTPLSVTYDLFVPINQRAEVSASWSLTYQTVENGAAAPAPGPYEASPFMIEYAVISFDADSNEVIEQLGYELIPFGSYLATPTGDFVDGYHSLLSAQGCKSLATLIQTGRIHRFTLVWALQTGDWNDANGLGGWQVAPFAQVFGPNVTTVPVVVPSMFNLNVRFFPSHVSLP